MRHHQHDIAPMLLLLRTTLMMSGFIIKIITI